MTDKVEKQLETLESELKALKITFNRASSSLEIYANLLHFETTPDQVVITGPDAATYYGAERVELTFDALGGVNALAVLEMTGNYNSGVIYRPPIVRRVPYIGGARWIIESWPYGGGTPIEYDFTVVSNVDGVLSAKMIWES